MEKGKKENLDASVIKRLTIGKVFKDGDQQIIGIDFSIDGELLATYTESSLTIYQVSNAKKIKVLHNKITRISHLKFTHSNSTVLFTPQMPPFHLFLWSIYENEIVKTFAGGETKIDSLQTNSYNDLVLIVDRSKSLRLYDIFESNTLWLKIDFSDQLSFAAALSPSGEMLVTATTTKTRSTYVEFHNIQQSYKGIFKRFEIKNFNEVLDIRLDYHSVNLFFVFKGGKAILFNTINENIIDIPIVFKYSEKVPEINFSPDSKFIFITEGDSFIKVLEIKQKNVEKMITLQGHIGSCYSAKFCPKYLLVASACYHTIFWVPSFGESSS